jgi:hypothetical protein
MLIFIKRRIFAYHKIAVCPCDMLIFKKKGYLSTYQNIMQKKSVCAYMALQLPVEQLME